MGAYRKFSDILQNEDFTPTPPKTPKVDPTEQERARTLGRLGALGGVAGETENSPPWSEAEDERAAIVEYTAGVPRAWAEGFARLDPDRPPGDVPPRRWRRFVDDCGRFLDGGFAARAAALGWVSCDLFGCDRDRPFARIDQAGLLWLLDGDRLIALSENTATVETGTGTREIWRRKSSASGRALVWKLENDVRD